MANNVGKALTTFTPVERAGGGLLRRMLTIAIEGGSVLPGARQAAAKALQARGEHEPAIDALIRQHTALAGAQGFATNVGGLVAALAAVPANVAGLAMLELRLVSGIAHLRGYDLDDDRVRSAVMLTLLGPDGDPDLKLTPMLVATAPVFDAELDRQISEKVMAELLTVVGGRRAATLVGRRVPVLGGGIGAALDGWRCHEVGRYAHAQFVARRVAR